MPQPLQSQLRPLVKQQLEVWTANSKSYAVNTNLKTPKCDEMLQNLSSPRVSSVFGCVFFEAEAPSKYRLSGCQGFHPKLKIQ